MTLRRRYRLEANGQLSDARHQCVVSSGTIDATDIEVPYLRPHVVTFDISTKEKTDQVKVWVSYSCHCWSQKPVPGQTHAIQVQDGGRRRIIDAARLQQSQSLRKMIEDLGNIKIYVTKSERNYGCYRAKQSDWTQAYTADFTIKPERRKFDNIRCQFSLRVESAYTRGQPEKGGSKTSLRPVIAKAREGKVVKYRKP
ncbi:MAG: hypothetical protein OXD33_05130 [Rhodobacteraceae bacterium]|nr:hypothetical protein [Paracoccaceae bacterium]MCY4327496.1 hypothetical protein [Paracoccaceae bacterium]